MFERFTDRARKVMALANQEAQRYNHEYIGTEHILLGLVKEGAGAAAGTLKSLGVEFGTLRAAVEKLVKRGPETKLGKLPQTPRAKRVIEYAIEESRNLGHSYVGTEHMLLGLLREKEGVAAQVLLGLGLQLDRVRDAIRRYLGADIPDPRHEPSSAAFAADATIDPERARLLETVFQEDEAARLLRRAMEELRQRIVQAGENDEFELAAGYRDLVGAVSCTLHRLAWVLWRKPPPNR